MSESAAQTWPACPTCGTDVEEVVTPPEREKRLECPSCGWRSDRSAAWRRLRCMIVGHRLGLRAGRNCIDCGRRIA